MQNLISKITPFLLCLIPLISIAQYPCVTGGRYDSEIFTAVTTDADITYGSAKDLNNVTQTLKLDVYQPDGDTAAKRPLIIFGHGGSFIGGTKADNDVVTLCQRFARRGYVCVSYNYRIGIGLPIDQAHASRAVYRATQDAKAVVRFFRKDAATSNTYKIDPNYIYLGGSSAGAFIALHYAYLDQQPEVPSYIDTSGIGTIEGTSGNPGYNSDVNAIINLCGALGDVAWMNAGDEPVCSMHGTNDQTVPYATNMILVLGFPIMVIDGSHTVDSMAEVLALDHVFHTWEGADHVPYAANAAYMDSTVEFIRDFLCTQNLKGSSSGVLENKSELEFVKIYPTVSSEEIKIENLNSGTAISVELIDIFGRTVCSTKFIGKEFSLSKGDLPRGIYFLKVGRGNSGKVEKIIFQ